MTVKKHIIYPFFLEVLPYCDEPFWENIFEDLSYGKACQGTYISKNFLCCAYKGKEFSYKIERKDPKILYDEIYTLLTEKIGVLSHKEKLQKKLLFQDIENNIRESRKDWSNIRRKNVKDVMYEKYVIDMKNKYNLTFKQCRYLLSVILISIMFKTITTKDVIFSDERIQKIEGIEFETGNIILKRSLTLQGEKRSDVVTTLPEDVKTLSENWEKFLKSLRALKT